VISLGSYKLDVEEMLLIRDDEEVILEPKVLEVLLYFIENKARYITMDELHENLWRGRIVSDAAVRRIVSKLRILFNDDHKSPNYIKSLPKRGYKLICEVTFEEVAPKSILMLSANTSQESNAAAELSSINFFLFNKRNVIFKAFLFILLLLAGNVFYTANDKTKTMPPLKPTITIKSLPGNKLAVSQSQNNQFIAFSGQINEGNGYQVYLKKRNEHDFLPITSNAFFPIALAFSLNSNNLFYSNMKKGESSLNKIDLTSFPYKVDTLLQNYFNIGDVFTSLNTKLIYFSGQKKINEPTFIYSYNFETKKTKQITSSTQSYYNDIKGDLTPNEKLIAIVRYSKYDRLNEIRIINLLTNEVIYRRKQEQSVYAIKWLDNENLLILDKNKLIKLNYAKELELKILDEKHNLANISVVDKQHILAITRDKKSPHTLFFEQQLPFDDWSISKIHNLESNIYYLAHQANSKSKLILSRNANTLTLAKLNPQNNETISHIQTNYKLNLMGSIISANKELIKIKGRFALLDTKTNNLTYITSGDDFIGDAALSHDEHSVLFTIKNYNQWEVYSYNIVTKEKALLFEGFQFVSPYESNYIVGTDEGNLFFIDAVTKESIALNYNLSTEHNTYWEVKNNFIYWSTHNLKKTVFHQLDISDIKNPIESKKMFDYDLVRPTFSIKHDGTSITYPSRERETFNLVILPIL